MLIKILDPHHDEKNWRWNSSTFISIAILWLDDRTSLIVLNDISGFLLSEKTARMIFRMKKFFLYFRFYSYPLLCTLPKAFRCLKITLKTFRKNLEYYSWLRAAWLLSQILFQTFYAMWIGKPLKSNDSPLLVVCFSFSQHLATSVLFLNKPTYIKLLCSRGHALHIALVETQM